MSTTLDIQLLGKDYRVACTPDEEATLTTAVAMLEQRLAAAREKTRSNGERLAVMVALEMAHELSQIQSGKTTPHGALPTENSPLESENLQRRINSIEARIAAALEPNEKLF